MDKRRQRYLKHTPSVIFAGATALLGLSANAWIERLTRCAQRPVHADGHFAEDGVPPGGPLLRFDGRRSGSISSEAANPGQIAQWHLAWARPVLYF